MSNERDFACVHLVGTVAEADVVKGFLRANGILADIANEGTAVWMDGMVSGNKGVGVLVPRESLEAARRLLDEVQEFASSDEAPDGEEE